ncbi:MAG: PAS domain S-box protein, partial [bacterium]|nr:PAS domain S-box protein [bacterium]
MKDNDDLRELREKFEKDMSLKVKILDITPDSVIVHNLAGEIIYINNAGCQVRGYSREEVLNLRMTDLVSPDFAVFAKQQIEMLWANGSADFEALSRRKDGSEYVSEVHAIVCDLGNTKVAIGHGRDITERKKMENELREREERFRNFALMSPVGIFLTDINGEYQYVNK